MEFLQALKIYECSFDESPKTYFFRRLFPGGHGSAVQNLLYAHAELNSVEPRDSPDFIAVRGNRSLPVILQFVRPCNPDKLE